MDKILSCIFVLILELNIYYCIGCTMNKMRFFPKISGIMSKFVAGFVGYHFGFWCLSLISVLLDITFQMFFYIWLGGYGILFLIMLFVCRDEIAKSYLDIIKQVKKYYVYVIPVVALHIFIIYFVCTNGQVDLDARTFISEVTTIVDTNKLSGIQTATGQVMSDNYLKRAFSFFGINSAVFCKLFTMHPLIYCRCVRASMNIILLAAGSFEVLKLIYKSSKNQIQDAMMSLMLAQTFLFVFDNSVYSNASFILYRAYEGKAYLSGSLILIVLFFSISLCKQNDLRYFCLLFMSMVVGVSISPSAAFVLPIVVTSITVPYIMIQRKYKLTMYLSLTLFPSIIYLFIAVI